MLSYPPRSFSLPTHVSIPSTFSISSTSRRRLAKAFVAVTQLSIHTPKLIINFSYRQTNQSIRHFPTANPNSVLTTSHRQKKIPATCLNQPSATVTSLPHSFTTRYWPDPDIFLRRQIRISLVPRRIIVFRFLHPHPHPHPHPVAHPVGGRQSSPSDANV